MNSIVVLDASVFVSWISASQRTPAAMRLLSEKDQYRFVVPSLFEVEVRNVLLSAERRNQWLIEDSEEALEILNSFNLVITPPRSGLDLDRVFRLARAERLTIYDAFYLDEAIAHSAALASRDAALLVGADRRGVEIMDMRASA